MEPSLSLELLGCLVLLGSLPVLMAFESALVFLDRSEKENQKEKLVKKWMGNPLRYLLTAKVAIILALLGAAHLGQLFLYGMFSQAGYSRPALTSGIISFLVLAIYTMLVGEVFGKTMGKKKTPRIFPKAVIILDLLYYLLLWIPVQIALSFSRFLHRAAGVSTDPERIIRTEEELKTLLMNGGQTEALEEEQTEMIHSIFEFGETVAREIMVPRTDMVCVAAEVTLQELMKCVTEIGHSRIPIYENKLDNIVGVLYAKDLLRYWREHQEHEDNGGEKKSKYNIRKLMRPVHFVPENKSVRDLLRDFRVKKMHLAIVVDEYGGTAGLVTIEDVLEEIVGEIQDEYDLEEVLYSVEEDGSYLVDAKMPVDEIAEKLEFDLEGEDYDTLGGFIFSVVGDVPSVGHEILHDGIKLTVVEADERHVIKARLNKLEPVETENKAVEED